jgi:hypothetical protein
LATTVPPVVTTAPTVFCAGSVPSYVQLNCVAAELLLPYASVKRDNATSTLAAPSDVGVNVAV